MERSAAFARSVPQMNVVLEFLWPVTLTDIIVADVI